jgi:hypothetical protein
MHGRQTPRLRDAQHLADDEAVVLEELQQRAIVAEIAVIRRIAVEHRKGWAID